MSQQGIADTPFALLLETEKAISALFKKAPAQVPTQKDWLGLSFLSGDHILLTPLDEVLGILPVTTFAYLAGVKPWLLGIATYRDDIFPVTDLAGFIGQRMSPLTKHSRVLVVDSQGEKAGLLVSRIMGLQRLSPEHTKSKGMMPEDPLYEPFLMGSWVDANVEFPIISCKSIIKHPKFRDVLVKAEVGNDLY